MAENNSGLRVVPASEPEKATQTIQDTITITPAKVDAWLNPPLQRPLKMSDKLQTIANEIKKTSVVPGVLTLGRLDGKTYLVDGQHRREAFKMSGIAEGYCDIRIHRFETMGELADEFVRLNSQIAVLKPDDILRAIEFSSEHLSKFRKRCPYVGYGYIRRNDKSPILSMSQTLRCWFSSAYETPKPGGMSVRVLADQFSAEDVELLSDFLGLAFNAWGRDAEYQRLWGTLNMTICMWIYRRMVLTQWSTRVPKLSKELFQKCLMALSADAHYCSWLVGRGTLSERDRSPAWNHIKKIFVARLEVETGEKLRMPIVAWATHSGGSH